MGKASWAARDEGEAVESIQVQISWEEGTAALYYYEQKRCSLVVSNGGASSLRREKAYDKLSNKPGPQFWLVQGWQPTCAFEVRIQELF